MQIADHLFATGTSDVPEDYWAHGMVPGISRQMRFPVLCSM